MLRGRSRVYLELGLSIRGTYSMISAGHRDHPEPNFLNGLSDNEKDENSFEL